MCNGAAFRKPISGREIPIPPPKAREFRWKGSLISASQAPGLVSLPQCPFGPVCDLVRVINWMCCATSGTEELPIRVE